MPFGRPTPQDDARAAAYRDWLTSRDPFAIASFVLGIFSLIEFGAILIFGIAGIILGILALKRIKSRAPAITGQYLATLGIILSALSLLIAAHFVYHWI
ncbi:MAG TPA: DUF4190 domain-containing protein [Tepidisphaeraceae bacterium]|jgi:uncharacterized YccA/Bax inhibitor family protein